jgi:hypothetical protein
MEQGVGGTPPVEFSEDHEKLVGLIAQFCDSLAHGAAYPIFGKMSEQDWHRWGYLH